MIFLIFYVFVHCFNQKKTKKTIFIFVHERRENQSIIDYVGGESLKNKTKNI